MSEHYTRVTAPPDDDGSAGWSCSCGVSGSVNCYDAEFVALRRAREHVDSIAYQWMLVYTIPHAEHGMIQRAEGPYSERAAMSRRNEIWDDPRWADMGGNASVEMVRHVRREEVAW